MARFPHNYDPYANLVTAGEHLYFIDHQDLSVSRVSGDEFERWFAKPTRIPEAFTDHRFLHTTIDRDGALWVLGEDGSIVRRRHGGALEAVTKPLASAAGHWTDQASLVHDFKHDRLVFFGGQKRNDTHVLDRGQKKLRVLDGRGPKRGMPSAVATSAGVFVATHDKIWLLVEDGWIEVATHPSEMKLVADEERKRLIILARRFAFQQEVRNQLFAASLDREGIGAWTELDDALALHAIPNGGYGLIGLDPQTDRLLFLTAVAQFVGHETKPSVTVELPATLMTVGAGFPTPAAKPTAARKGKAAWFRPAIALTKTKKRDALGRTIPDDRELLLVVPPRPALPCKSGFVVTGDPEHTEQAYELSLDSPTFAVRFVKKLETASIEGLVARETPFKDLDPSKRDEVDTVSGEEPDLATGSKLGGFPSLLHDHSHGLRAAVKCKRCRAKLVFAAQVMSPDLEFADLDGNLYVYVCPEGHSGAAFLQTS